MKKTINKSQSLNSSNWEKSFTIDYPSICPICDKSGIPSYLNSYFINDENIYPNLFIFFFCHNCEKMFIGNYHFDRFDCTSLMAFDPRDKACEKKFSENIKELSPNFCEIYNQAFASQQYGLNDISGMGYRKALEFLVKDYAISLNPEDEENIKKSVLSKCISNYIDNRRIKQLAVASAWLGNDETHYTKKHQEYNVDDLIAFIDATVSFIDSDLSALKAEVLIKSQKELNQS